MNDNRFIRYKELNNMKRIKSRSNSLNDKNQQLNNIVLPYNDKAERQIY